MKKDVLKIPQNSQEDLQIYQKRDSGTGVLIILYCNGKCGITTKLNIYHPFAISLVLICSRRPKRKQKKVADGVSGFDLYLLIEQLAVLPHIKIICLH